MSLFDSGSDLSLEDVLGQQAQDKVNSIDQQYAKKRRQSIAQQAHLGRLGSGVSNYQAGDLNEAEAGDIGDVYGDLSVALEQTPLADYAATRDNDRKRQLAELIGALGKRNKNPLLGAISGGASGAATGTAVSPGYGTVIGGVLGAGLGAFGES